MNAANRLIDTLTKKNWTSAEIDKMVGPAENAWTAHATDVGVRELAASGGATSAILVHALRSGSITGAVVCNSFVLDGKVRARFDIATTRDEILNARGSKYVETKFLADVLPLLRAHQGRVAVCGLPCDIANLKRWAAKDQEIADKIAVTISFFCGHNSRTALIDGVTEKLARKADGSLTSFRFRSGLWRGKLTAGFDNGEEITKPFSYFSDYRNLQFFSERKCMACTDHFAYAADIAIGDVWLFSHKGDEIKKSGILARTPRGARLVNDCISAGEIDATPVDRRTILDGQTRIAPTHYNVTARVNAGKILGVKLVDTVNEKTPPHKWLSAFIGLANMKWSESRFAQWIFYSPRPLLRGYLYFKKGLESLR